MSKRAMKKTSLKPEKDTILEDDPFVCAECGSDKVQVKEWVEINTGKNMGATSNGNEPQDNWCPTCGTHGLIINKSSFKQKETFI